MRIGLVVTEFPPDTIGGGGEVFEGLARGLAARGHEIVVITGATFRGARGDDARVYPFPVVRVPEFPHPSERFRTYMPPLPWRIASARRALANADVVNVHGYGSPFADAMYAFAVGSRPTVFTTHGFPYTAPSDRGLLGASYRAYDRLIGRRILGSTVVTAVSSGLARETEAIAGRTVDVVHNAFTPFAPGEPGPAARAEAERAPFLFAVGRLEPRKGFDRAIEILARVRATLPYRLLIAGGDNGEGPRLRALAVALGCGDAVVFLGRLARPALAWFYGRAAAVLTSSETESFSLSTLEGMACGGATVTAAVGGILDFARDGENALLYRYDDIGAGAEAVRRLAAEPDLDRLVRAAGRATAERFTWDRALDGYEDAYARAVAG